MRFYKLFLLLAILTIIALFFYPRVSAKADAGSFRIAPEASVQKQIKQYATSYGIDPTLALMIAQCESRLNPKAINPLSDSSGIYQFLPSSWKMYATMKWGKEKDIFNPSNNIELGTWVLSVEGTSPWLASRDCWSRYL